MIHETPRGPLMTLGAFAGVLGATAAHAGRYAGFVYTLLFVAIQVAERIAWARYRTPAR